MLLTPLILALPGFAPALPQAAEEPLPEGVIARISAPDLEPVEITREEYLEHLYAVAGKRQVQQMARDILLQAEAGRYGIEIDEAEVQRRVEERLRSLQESPRPRPFEEELKRNGQSLEMFRAIVEQETRTDMLKDALVRATRVVTDERLKQEFENRYGPGGVKLRLRHILVMPNFLKAEEVRAGRKPNEIDMEELRARARERIEEAARRIQEGEDFAAVAAEVSHDRVTRDQGGEIKNYNGRLYGPAFRDAVMSLDPGGVSDIVESGAGFHLVQLLDRTETRFEDVREELIEEILTAEPTWQEKTALEQALLSRARIQLW